MKNLSVPIISGGILFSLLGCNENVSREELKPNIIFIMADDLGYHDLGSYGQKKILTPHLDQMAREGMRFTNCYSGSTVCAPARSVLMTGQHTGRTTVRGNFSQIQGLPGGRVPLQENDTTVANVLKQAGYVTGITGKWGLGEPGTTGIPNRQGFDQWFGYLNQRHAHTYYPEYLWRNEEKVILEGNLDGKREVYTHDLFTNFALDFLKENQDTSFFLYLAYTVPHSDYEIPDTAPYTDSLWTDNEKIHAAMITRMDRDIGRMMQLLTDLGIDDNTMVFFCSDNGAAQFWEGRFDSSYPLRGRKRDMYEGGIRTPMVVRYPGRVPAGRCVISPGTSLMCCPHLPPWPEPSPRQTSTASACSHCCLEKARKRVIVFFIGNSGNGGFSRPPGGETGKLLSWGRI
jgi:arylsulfatase A-like enzyme